MHTTDTSGFVTIQVTIFGSCGTEKISVKRISSIRFTLGVLTIPEMNGL
jgi:hypothetical protein